MKKMLLPLLTCFSLVFTGLSAWSQGNTPQTISMAGGVSNSTAFGSQGLVGSDGGGVNFYVHWDAAYLYLGWSGGRTNYSSDMFYAAIDTDPNGTNGTSNAIEGVSFQPAAGTRKPDFYVVYENNSSFYGLPASNGNAFEIYTVSGGNWVFNSRTNGNDNVNSRIDFQNSNGEVRLRIAWSSLGFTPGASTPLGISMWNNNSSGNYMWARLPNENTANGATPKTLDYSFLFYNTASGVNPSAAKITEYNTFTIASFSGTQNLGLTISGAVSLSGDAVLNSNLNFLPGASLNLNNKNLTINTVTGTGTLSGTASSSLTVNGAAGNLSFTGGAQVLKDLSLNAGATATLATALAITAGTVPGTVTVAAGASLSTGGNLTLKSDDDGTARVANSAGTISGDVTVERNIKNPGHRAWHLLSTNTTGAQTIYNAWQEGGTNNANQGTLITSNLYNGSNGFDMSSNSASILTHNQGGLSGPSWNYNLANTNSTVLSAYSGYMLFVRGDRNYTPSSPSPTASNRTVLRSKGGLRQGTQSAVTVSATGTGRTLVGNPYASPIDMETVFTGTANLNPDMYVWDPAATGNYGVGAFVLVERNGGNYQQTPYGGSATADASSRYIASGQAFFLKATGADASVVFTENMKVANTPVVNPFAHAAGEQQLYVNLLLDNGETASSLADGIRVRFNDSYSSSAADDIEKMGNFAENIAVYRNAKKWIVEKRPMIGKRDTVFLRTGNLMNRKYILRIGSLDFVQLGITAYLEDSYTGKRTLLKLDGSANDIAFSVTAEAASASPDRFRIVFTAAQAAAPVDNPAITGVMIYPNPVMAGPVSVAFNNMPAAVYRLQLFNNAGQAVSSQAIRHTGANALYKLSVKQLLPGTYRLEIADQQGRTAMKMVYVLK